MHTLQVSLNEVAWTADEVTYIGKDFDENLFKSQCYKRQRDWKFSFPS